MKKLFNVLTFLGLASGSVSAQSIFVNIDSPEKIDASSLSDALQYSISSRLNEVLRSGTKSAPFIVTTTPGDVRLSSVQYIEQENSSWSASSQFNASVDLTLEAEYSVYELVMEFTVNHPNLGELPLSYRIAPLHIHRNFSFEGTANASFKPGSVLSKAGLPGFAVNFVNSLGSISLDQSGSYKATRQLFDEMTTLEQANSISQFNLQVFESVVRPLCIDLTRLPQSTVNASMCEPSLIYGRLNSRLVDAARAVLSGPPLSKISLDDYYWDIAQANIGTTQEGVCYVSGRLVRRGFLRAANVLDYAYKIEDGHPEEVSFFASNLNSDDRFIGQRLISEIMTYLTALHGDALKQKCQNEYPKIPDFLNDSLFEWNEDT